MYSIYYHALAIAFIRQILSFDITRAQIRMIRSSLHLHLMENTLLRKRVKYFSVKLELNVKFVTYSPPLAHLFPHNAVVNSLF